MKKPIQTAAIAVIIIAILAKLGVFNTLMLFVLVGAVPGTDYSLPSSFMLLVMLSALWFIALRHIALKTAPRKSTRRVPKHSATHKRSMPRRRFSEI